MVKFPDYINKQKNDCNLYIDYIIACKKLNIDLSVNQNKYPNNFDKWHDKRIDEYTKSRPKKTEKQERNYMKSLKKLLPNICHLNEL